VTASEVGKVNCAVIPHVCGAVRDIAGSQYGVDGKITIRSETKLKKILEAARIVVGERYIWLDVSCMDQKRKNELGIAKMKSYFENATGCPVWLDDALEESSWADTQSAIKEVNGLYNLDESGTPTKSSADLMRDGMAVCPK